MRQVDHLTVIIALANTFTLVFGGVVTALAWRAARRTGAPALRALALGLGLVTLGALLGGTLHQIAGFEFQTAIAVHSVFTAIGFGTLAYSLYAEMADTGSPSTPSREHAEES